MVATKDQGPSEFTPRGRWIRPGLRPKTSQLGKAASCMCPCSRPASKRTSQHSNGGKTRRTTTPPQHPNLPPHHQNDPPHRLCVIYVCSMCDSNGLILALRELILALRKLILALRTTTTAARLPAASMGEACRCPLLRWWWGWERAGGGLGGLCGLWCQCSRANKAVTYNNAPNT